MEREKFVEVTLYQIYKPRTTARPRDWKPTQWYNQPNWSYELWFNLPKWQFNWVPWESNGISMWYYGIWSAWNDIYNRQYIYIWVCPRIADLHLHLFNEKHDDKPWDFENFPHGFIGDGETSRFCRPPRGWSSTPGRAWGSSLAASAAKCVHWNNPRVDKGLKPRMWSSKTPKPMLKLAVGMQNQHGSEILSQKMKFRQVSWSHGILMMIKQGSFGGVVRKMSDTSTSSTRLWVTGRAPRRLQRFHMVLIDVGVPKVVHLKPPFTETTGFDHA